MVHATRNLFPEAVLMGVTAHNFVSGHVWCRVTIGGAEKDVCPGRKENVPGKVYFRPLSRVRDWNRGIEFVTYYGPALYNLHRKRKYGKQKRKQENGG